MNKSIFASALSVVLLSLGADAKFVKLKPLKLGKTRTNIQIFSNGILVSNETSVNCTDQQRIEEVEKKYDTSLCKSNVLKDTSTEATAVTKCVSNGVNKTTRVKFTRISDVKQIVDSTVEEDGFRIVTEQDYIGGCNKP